MDKRFLAILGVIAAIFIGIFIFTQGGNDKGANNSAAKQEATNHVKGQNAKNVTLMEYGDYQCPICGLYEPTIEQVYNKYQKDIQFQFRNLPLVSIHPNAFAAARAAEAAGMQNKYWEMHDKLYQNQNSWSGSNNALNIFKQYAQQIGLDVNKFTADYAKKEVNDAINADLAAFGKTGQEQATPTFFINGKYISNTTLSDDKGTPSVDKFSQQLDAAIAASK
ncbi:MAG TPA: thioredoxin domain-containing protein [Candidatus Saccharimonadales bacterium]|nr:thioredoxin domain-containing protein [Candidatus Saccharimonadales bacterium]